MSHFLDENLLVNVFVIDFSHLENKEECKISTGGHYCPQCFSKYCDLPVECKVCALTLVSAPHLARSYHHLFPIKPYDEIDFDNQTDKCYACQIIFTNQKYVSFCSISFLHSVSKI